MDKFKIYPILSSDSGVMVGGYQNIVSDPFGSYTGRPLDKEDTPVQDADDL